MQSVAPQIARRINDRVALDLMLSKGVMTRSGMRAALGMSQPSTLELFERLLAENLIEEAGTVSGRRGPKANSYRVNTRRAMVAVARVARTEIVAGVSDLSGQLVAMEVSDAPEDGEALHTRVAETVRAAMSCADVAEDALRLAVVATQGVVDPTTGDVGYVANRPQWRGALRARLETDLGVPTHLENQVNLLGLAELQAGRPDGPADFVLVSVGPAGIAAAVVIDGKLWRGANGAAGEIAYLPTGQDLPALGPDNTVSGSMGELLGGLASDQPPHLEAMVRPLTHAVAAICTVVDPKRVVLAGPLGRAAGEALATAVEESLASIWPLRVQVTPTRVSGDAVLKGAAQSGLDRLLPQLWGPQTGLTKR